MSSDTSEQTFSRAEVKTFFYMMWKNPLLEKKSESYFIEKCEEKYSGSTKYVQAWIDRDNESDEPVRGKKAVPKKTEQTKYRYEEERPKFDHRDYEYIIAICNQALKAGRRQQHLVFDLQKMVEHL